MEDEAVRQPVISQVTVDFAGNASFLETTAVGTNYGEPVLGGFILSEEGTVNTTNVKLGGRMDHTGAFLYTNGLNDRCGFFYAPGPGAGGGLAWKIYNAATMAVIYDGPPPASGQFKMSIKGPKSATVTPM